jgi:hypothetical protein
MDVGATFRHVHTWRDDAGVRVDLTGYTANMQVRTSRGTLSMMLMDLPSTALRLQEDVDADGSMLGVVVIQIAPSLQDIPSYVKSGYYDLVLTSPAGIRTRLLEGAFVFNAMTTEVV